MVALGFVAILFVCLCDPAHGVDKGSRDGDDDFVFSSSSFVIYLSSC